MSRFRPSPSTSASPLSRTGFDVDAREPPAEGQIASYQNVIEAEIARGRLEAAGIPARVVDANTVSVAQVLSDLVGGVKITVPLEHVDEARAVLATPAEVLVEPAAPEVLVGADRAGPPPARAETREDLSLRAFRASMIGFVVLPPILHLYSLWLLARRARLPHDDDEPESAISRGRAAAALAVDATVLGLVAFVVLRL